MKNERSRIVTLLRVITPQTMIYYSNDVEAYERVAELVGYPLDNGPVQS